MNESTLVPREEMSDLDWLARNVHVWVEDWTHVRKCQVRHEARWMASLSPNAEYKDWRTKAQWLSRRSELQNKPSWNDAPEWAEWLAQDEDGEWKWLAGLPGKYVDGWTSVKIKGCCKGLALGDWRDTLEKRPEQKAFEPFVSVEDAATAKQSEPKGSGNPILGMVLADLTNRALEGKEKYGEPLLAHNGRNPLWDAYQEALDLAMYLRQAIEEQK